LTLFRLTPAYALLVGIMATLLPYIGSGPYWTIIDRWAGFCETNWWTNLLYVNNFVNTSYLVRANTTQRYSYSVTATAFCIFFSSWHFLSHFQCQGEAWYLANDMQFYVVSPAFIYPLYRWETLGLVWMGIATVASCLAPAFLVHFLDTVPTTIGTRE